MCATRPRIVLIRLFSSYPPFEVIQDLLGAVGLAGAGVAANND